MGIEHQLPLLCLTGCCVVLSNANGSRKMAAALHSLQHNSQQAMWWERVAVAERVAREQVAAARMEATQAQMVAEAAQGQVQALQRYQAEEKREIKAFRKKMREAARTVNAGTFIITPWRCFVIHLNPVMLAESHAAVC